MHLVCAQNHFQSIYLHWHSWFIGRSWAFGVLPETYFIDMLHYYGQVSNTSGAWFCFGFESVKLGGEKEELKKNRRYLSRQLRSVIKCGLGAPASPCMTCSHLCDRDMRWGSGEFGIDGINKKKRRFFWWLMMWCDINGCHQDSQCHIFIDNEMKWDGRDLSCLNTTSLKAEII